MTPSETSVLFLVGPLRSGSTILTSIIGSSSGYFAAGELGNLWRWAADGGRCACDAPLVDCPIWGNVLRLSLRGTPCESQLRELQSLRDDAIAKRGALRRVASQPATSEYLAQRSALYDAIAQVTGARVIVDSTKHNIDAWMLRRLRNVKFLLLNRDIRGVMASESRRSARHAGISERELPPSRSAARSLISWLLVGCSMAIFARVERERSLCIWHEEFCDDLRAALNKVSALTSISMDVRLKNQQAVISDFAGHQCSGNPVRFQRGVVHVHPDERWRDGLRAAGLARLLAKPIDWALRRP